MIVEEIEERWVTDKQGERLLLKRYYPEHKMYAYIKGAAIERFPREFGIGYGFIKESAIDGIQDLGKDTR